MSTDITIRKKLTDLRVIDLRNELGKRDLDKTGIKAELMERLQKAIEGDGHNAEEYLFEVNEASLKNPTNGSAKEENEKKDSTGTESGEEDMIGKVPGKGVSEKSQSVNTVETKGEEDVSGKVPEKDVSEKFQSVRTVEAEDSERMDHEPSIVKDLKEDEPRAADTHRDSVVKTDDGKKDIAGEKSAEKVMSEKGSVLTELHASDIIKSSEEHSGTFGKEQGVENDTECSEIMTANEDSALDVHVFDPENDLDADILNNGKGNKDTIKLYVGEKAEEQGEIEDATKSEEAQKNDQENRSLEKKDDSKTAKSTSPKETKSEHKTAGGEIEPLSEKNLWITGLAPSVKAVDLKSLFGKYGKLFGAKIVTNVKKPGSKCYGFVIMSSAEEAKKCIQQLNNSEFHGMTISVDKAKANLGSKTLATKKQSETKKDKPIVKKDDKGKESVKRESPRRRHRRTPDRKERYGHRHRHGSHHSDSRRPSRSGDRKDDKDSKKESHKGDEKEKKKSDEADDKSEKNDEEKDTKKEGEDDAKSETHDGSKTAKKSETKDSERKKSRRRSHSRSHSRSRSRADSRYESERKMTLNLSYRLKMAKRQILKLTALNKDLSIKLMKQRREHGDQMRLQSARMRRFRDEFEKEKLEIKLEREIVRREKEEFRNEMMRQEEAMRRPLKRSYDSRGSREDGSYFTDAKRTAMADNRYDSFQSKRPVFIEDGRRESTRGGGRIADRRKTGGDRYRVSDRTSSHDHARTSRASPVRAGQRQQWGDSSWSNTSTSNTSRQSERYTGSGNFRGQQDRSSNYSMHRGTVSSNVNSGMYMNSGQSHSSVSRDSGSMGARHQDNRYGSSGTSGNIRRY